jgi:hypothetical protein
VDVIVLSVSKIFKTSYWYLWILFDVVLVMVDKTQVLFVSAENAWRGTKLMGENETTNDDPMSIHHSLVLSLPVNQYLPHVSFALRCQDPTV